MDPGTLGSNSSPPIQLLMCRRPNLLSPTNWQSDPLDSIDIRSYFMIGGSKNKKETDKKAQIQDEKTSKPKKKRAIILSSDSEDENPASKRQRDSNALDLKSPSNKKLPNGSSYPTEKKTVDPKDVFGNEKVKRSTLTTSSKRNIEFGVLSLGAACNDVTEECACVDVKSIEKEV
ncbi:unnamed protein product [Timema podura]|uniref:Uncharacterized protein n=1 Tax=Timema podura TaxID=61482 RepID=A0ABN7NMR7_TIMPD|nr:unnamed protein product [Timema podura]